jgi:hypothetical protein
MNAAITTERIANLSTGVSPRMIIFNLWATGQKQCQLRPNRAKRIGSYQSKAPGTEWPASKRFCHLNCARLRLTPIYTTYGHQAMAARP